MLSEEKKEKIKDLIHRLAGFMNLDCQVEVRDGADEINSVLVSVYTSSQARFLIGKNGQNLRAIEHLLRAVLFKEEKEFSPVSIDVNDYRKSRANYIIEAAKHVVMKVRNTQRAETLGPLPPNERRIVHMELASYPDISTESIGQDPQRKIVIKPFP